MPTEAVRLKDLLQTSRDGEWGESEPAPGLVPMSVIRGTDFQAVRLGVTEGLPVRYIRASAAERKRLRANDILIETAGGTQDRPTGRTVLLRPSLFRRLSLPVTCASFARYLRVDPGVADPAYVYWYLQELYRSGQMDRHQVQHTGLSRFQFTRFAATSRVPLPPRSDQEATAQTLNTLDDKIEVNRRTSETLARITRAAFKASFGGLEGAAAWRTASLAELFPAAEGLVLTGPFGSHLHARDYRESGTPLILVKHVDRGSISESGLPLVGDHIVADLERYRLQAGDIVFTRVGAVGRTAYVHPRNEGWLISGQLLRIRLPDSQSLEPRYLAQVFLEPEFIESVEAAAVGSTRPSLNTELVRSLRFPLPPIAKQREFADLAELLDQRSLADVSQSRLLAAVRDLLLGRFISGEVRIAS